MMDTTQKEIYPCEPATTEQLDEMLREIVYRRKEADLKRFVCRSAPGEVRWERVRHLRITSNPGLACTLGLLVRFRSSYFHASADGSWLVIFTDTLQMDNYLKYCGDALESLWIHGIDISRLPGLENLTRLTSLDLSQCRALTKLPGLDSLTRLTSLDLSGCRALEELPGLGSLTQLTDLNLSDCRALARLPELGSLTRLTSLNLSDCRALARLPGLGSLTRLIFLNLSECSSLIELPGLGSLTQLTSMNLSWCRALTELSGLGSLTRLTSLNLSWCRFFTELPAELRDMEALRYLDLSGLMLRTLPDWLPDIAERFSLEPFETEEGHHKAVVHLFGTTVEDMPDLSIFEQPYEMVAAWFKARKQGDAQLLNEIKVVFLGDGEAGKSHTIARLMNDGGAPDHVVFDGQSTPGIVIRNKEYGLDGRKITVHYWDFGGQEIMHSMHRIFLTGRTMYVVLLNARDDTQSDRAKYWLHNVQSFAPGAPILLVLNKIDQNENASVDENYLRSRYDKLTRIVRLSALKYSREKFNSVFTDALLEEIHNTNFLNAEWPTAWTKVRDRLVNMESYYIRGDDYQSICRECQVEDTNQENLLHWFHDLGISFCCDGEDDYTLKDYVILRPDWITNALYILLFNRLEGANNGLIPHRSIFDILQRSHRNPSVRCTLPNTRYRPEDIQFVLGIMRKFSLSFPHGTNHEFIPMLCQQDSTVDIQDYHEDADTLEFNMEFDYLPNNLLHRLMVERPVELDMNNVWRTGARFMLGGTKLSAVVVIDGNTLCFFIRGDNPMHRRNTYLAMLKANVDRIVDKMGLKPPTCHLIYKLDGKRDEFEYEEVMLSLELGDTTMNSKAHRRKIPIADILNQSAPEEPQTCSALAASPTVINHFHDKVFHVQGNMVRGDHVEGDKINGDQYNHVIPEALTAILDKLITENIQTQRDFADRLLSQVEASKDEAARAHFVDDLMPQLEASEDKAIREIAEEARTDSNKKRNILTALRKIVGGSGSAVSFLADAPEAVKTLAAITTAVTTVAAKYGPAIEKFISQIQILPL